MRSIYLQCFMLIPLIVLELCPRQSSKCKNEQRAIIKKLGKAGLLFLCTAHLLDEIYLPTKFHVWVFIGPESCGKFFFIFKLFINSSFSLNSPDNVIIVSKNKIKVPHVKNLKKVISTLKSVKLYFDNFHCEIIKYNFHR
jgi:hypothetical protein